MHLREEVCKGKCKEGEEGKSYAVDIFVSVPHNQVANLNAGEEVDVDQVREVGEERGVLVVLDAVVFQEHDKQV
jgi:hypothetical protein